MRESSKTYNFLTHPSLIFGASAVLFAKWYCVKHVRAHPPRAGRHKGRRACHGRSVAPVPLKGRSARVAGPGSRVWLARDADWSRFWTISHTVVRPLWLVSGPENARWSVNET